MVFFAEPFGIPSLRSPAKKLLELLFDYEIEKKPLLFHVFSNGGVMLYRYILDLIHTHRQFSHLRVVGTIFDSAPGSSNLVGAVRALSTILETKRPATRIFLLLAFTLVAVMVRLLLSPITSFFHVNHYDALMKQSSRWPELYLYSKADRIIRASDIEHMVVARLEHQVMVRAVDFSASAHVSHLRDYPTYYTSLCLSFLYSCVHM
ncbi:transmembrane protein 53 isoform X1 [Macrotis lagotis]